MFKNLSKSNLIVYILFETVALLSLLLLILLPIANIIPLSITHIIMNIAIVIIVWAPILAEKIIKIKLDLTTLLAYQLFVFLSSVIGTFWGGYEAISFYDIVMHTLSGVLISLIAYRIYAEKTQGLQHLAWIFIISFSIAMCAGALWELWEFAGDEIFGLNSQQYLDANGNPFVGQAALMDTMIDVICNTVGALAGSITAVFIEKNYRKNLNFKIKNIKK